MKIGITRKERNIIIGIGLFIICLPIIFTRELNLISFKDTGAIGDTIGGITAPFISFFGAILVYLALRAQIDANEQIKEQFERQNNDQIFFRIVDSLNTRIVNYSANNAQGQTQI